MQRPIQLFSLVILGAICAAAIWVRPDTASAAAGDMWPVLRHAEQPGMADRFYEEKRRAAAEPLPAQF